MGFMKRLESILSAVSFAEEGEYKTARELMKEELPDETRPPRPESCEGAQPRPANS